MADLHERDPFDVKMERMEELLFNVVLADERNDDDRCLPGALIWEIEEVLGCTCHPKLARLPDCAFHKRLEEEAELDDAFRSHP